MEPITNPKPVLHLDGSDGNGALIIGRAQKALRKSGATEDYVAEFTKEVTSRDYDHLLQVIFKYFEVEIR